MDVAGVALALVVLGHEGQRLALLGRDLLGAVLVDAVLSAVSDDLVELEGDLVLAEVALALRRLDDEPRPVHVVADGAQQRLDPAGAEQRVVDVVLVGRRQRPVGGVPGLLVGVVEDDELELGAGERVVAERSAARSTWRLQDLSGRLEDRASGRRRARPGRTGSSRVPGSHGIQRMRVEDRARTPCRRSRPPTS